MKIGVEAKWFFEGPASGRVVIRNLVKQIIDLDTNDELYIFLDIKAKNKAFPHKAPNVHLVYVWAGNNMLSNVFVMPFYAWSLHLDICIFQNFIPLISNFKRYAYIHDVLFNTHPEYYSLIERIYLWPLKYLSRFSHRLCTVSQTEKQRMVDAGYGKEPLIDVVYHGVDDCFKPQECHLVTELRNTSEKYGLPEKFILYVGRLNVRKNIFNLLKAIPNLKDSSIPLVIVGGYDWKMTSVDNLLDVLGISNRVIFTGPVYGDDLPRIYALATVLCFVSYAESFGLPALEGMASGVPVVISNRTCLPEICGNAALYADPDSPVEIAQMIDRLLENKLLWQNMRMLGLQRAQNFTWSASAKNLIESAYRAVRKD